MTGVQTCALPISKYSQEQLNLLDDFLFYFDWAADRRKIISALKFDTQGAGKNLPESKIYEYKYNKLMEGKTVFSGVTDLVQKTILHPFKDNVLDVAIKIYKDTIAVHNFKGTLDALEEAMDTMYASQVLKPEHLYKVYGILTNAIMQNNLENKNEWFQANVFGENSVAKRIAKLIKSEEMKGNFLFDSLLTVDFGTKEGEPDAIKFDNTIRIDKALEAVINEGFKDFQNKHPFLYRDLIKLSLFQTGVIQSPVSFYRYIPVDDFVEVSRNLLTTSYLDNKDAYKIMIQNLPLVPGLAPKISWKLIMSGNYGLPDKLEIKGSGKIKNFITKSDKEGLGLYEIGRAHV